jgi:hypothetical protein
MTRYDPYSDRFIGGGNASMIQRRWNPAEEVYGQHTDTAGNFHWCGVHSGEHTVKEEEGTF